MHVEELMRVVSGFEGIDLNSMFVQGPERCQFNWTPRMHVNRRLTAEEGYVRFTRGETGIYARRENVAQTTPSYVERVPVRVPLRVVGRVHNNAPERIVEMDISVYVGPHNRATRVSILQELFPRLSVSRIENIVLEYVADSLLSDRSVNDMLLHRHDFEGRADRYHARVPSATPPRPTVNETTEDDSAGRGGWEELIARQRERALPANNLWPSSAGLSGLLNTSLTPGGDLTEVMNSPLPSATFTNGNVIAAVDPASDLSITAVGVFPAGAEHSPPAKGTKAWDRVVRKGCIGKTEQNGTFSCAKTWPCHKCPVTLEQQEKTQQHPAAKMLGTRLHRFGMRRIQITVSSGASKPDPDEVE